MLPDGEDEGVVHRQPRTLRLCNVQVMALGMWRGVAGEEGVRRVDASMNDGQGEGERVWIVFDGMLSSESVHQHHSPQRAERTRGAWDDIP